MSARPSGGHIGNTRKNRYVRDLHEPPRPRDRLAGISEIQERTDMSARPSGEHIGFTSNSRYVRETVWRTYRKYKKEPKRPRDRLADIPEDDENGAKMDSLRTNTRFNCSRLQWKSKSFLLLPMVSVVNSE